MLLRVFTKSEGSVSEKILFIGKVARNRLLLVGYLRPLQFFVVVAVDGTDCYAFVVMKSL